MIIKILEALQKEGPLAPGDVAQKISEPRYKVLAAFHCLKELGFIGEVYSKGSYKLFRISILGEAVLKEAYAKGSIARVMEETFTGSLERGDGEVTDAVSLS